MFALGSNIIDQTYSRNKSLDSKTENIKMNTNSDDYVLLNFKTKTENKRAPNGTIENRNSSVPKLNFQQFDVSKGSKSTRREINNRNINQFNSVENVPNRQPYLNPSNIRIHWPSFVNQF